jgi:GABA permease
MRNPLRSEAEAFRFLVVSIVGALIIVAGAYIDTWVGVAAAVIVIGAIARWYWRQPSPTMPRLRVESDDAMHRILVVANETVGGPELRDELRQRAGTDRAKVLVVAPALNSPLRHWASDEDDARAAAQARLDQSVESLRAVGLDVAGEVGDGDPLQAIEDAIRTFQPDELVVSTHPEGKSHWLERGVVEQARERFALPLTHVVVDLDADQS